jgi:hypothetical protein
LISPDPVLFGQVGLTHGATNSTGEAFNPNATSHFVTATAKGFQTIPGDDSSRPPVPGATVDFEVLTGMNAGKSGQDITDGDGKATFEYDDIRNGRRCDADFDNDIDNADINIIRAAYTGQPGSQVAAGPDTQRSDTIQASIGTLDSNIVTKTWVTPDPRDGNGNGVINAQDVRFCSLARGTP